MGGRHSNFVTSFSHFLNLSRKTPSWLTNRNNEVVTLCIFSTAPPPLKRTIRKGAFHNKTRKHRRLVGAAFVLRRITLSLARHREMTASWTAKSAGGRLAAEKSRPFGSTAVHRVRPVSAGGGWGWGWASRHTTELSRQGCPFRDRC